ncbi:MAG: type II toxin-antitoxin system RelE/ParE family toxin [Rhizobiaceae bacterium]
MNEHHAKPLFWIASSRKDLKGLPLSVRRGFGLSLFAVQMGETPPSAKPLKGFGGAGVLELIEDDRGSTYRAVYTLRFRDAVYVLHAFQKKSKHGIATPKQEIDLIKDRLRLAEDDHANRSKVEKK